MFNVRTYTNEDQQSVIQLWHEAGLVVDQNNPQKDIQRKLEVGSDLFLVGEFKGLVVATVMGGYEGHRGWINYLAVHPNYQRRGFAKIMMTEVEAKLSSLDCPKINLQIRASNDQVVKFYQSIGYVEDEVISFGKRLRTENSEK